MSGHFLIRCLVAFLAVLVGYFLAIDRILIPDRMIPKSYRQFLLLASENIPGRIIVESGSNAIHGIDVALLEDATGRASFNIADNGGYPLEHKIYRLRRSLSEGDIAILPIEWLHYADGNRLGKAYVESVVMGQAPNAFYYHSLPLVKKIEFTFFHLPYGLAVRELLIRSRQIFASGNGAAERLSDLNKIKASLDVAFRGSMVLNEDLELERLTAALACDRYLFGIFMERFAISEKFLANLRLLEKVEKESGAKFLFTWPTVAAKDDVPCYGKVKEQLDAHSNRIRELLAIHGFTVLGRVDDSVFPKECILDNYYHVRQPCGRIRTERLIEQLAELEIPTGSAIDSGRVNAVLQNKWQHWYDQFATPL